MRILFVSLLVISTFCPARSQEKDTTHLAIVVGGAVSLGAFEAGAMAELLMQLELNNESPFARQFYIVDVLVGASAGSMNAGLFARELYDGPKEWASYSSDTTNVFYHAWVLEADIEKFFPKKRLKNDPFLLESQPIEAIAEKSLSMAPAGRKIAIAPDSMYVSMALSNMEGLKYEIDFAGAWTDEVYFFDDRRYFVIGQGRPIHLMDWDGRQLPDTVSWNIVGQTAIASGSFPLAFRPKKLIRYRSEYGVKNPPVLNCDRLEFPYVDGGFFNNTPFDHAAFLADMMDSTDLGRSRKIVFIAPEVDIETDSLAKQSRDYTSKLDRYVRKILSMAYLTVEGTGHRMYLSNKARNEDLQNVLRSSGYDSASIMNLAQKYDLTNTGRSKLPFDPNTKKRKWRETLRKLFRVHPDSSILVISNDPDTKLKGSNYAHFGGFFRKDLRHTDYQLGRYFAQRMLERNSMTDIREPLSEDSVSFWRDSVRIPSTLRAHIQGHERPFRKKLEDRFVAYLDHLKVSCFLKPIAVNAFDKVLDDEVYYVAPWWYTSWQVNSERRRSFSLGVLVSPVNLAANLGRFCFIDPKNSIWRFIESTLAHQSYFVADWGLRDFVSRRFVGSYYLDLGARMYLGYPKGMSMLRFTKIAPEYGIRIPTEKYRTENGLSSHGRIPYMGMSLRFYFIDIRYVRLSGGNGRNFLTFGASGAWNWPF